MYFCSQQKKETELDQLSRQYAQLKLLDFPTMPSTEKWEKVCDGVAAV